MGYDRSNVAPPPRAEILKLAQDTIDYRVRFTPAVALELARFILREERERQAVVGEPARDTP